MDLFDGTLMSGHRSSPKAVGDEANDAGRLDDANTADESSATGVD